MGNACLTQRRIGDREIERIARAVEVHGLQRVDGVDLPPTNFVVEGGPGRFWITVSTRRQPRALGYRRECEDGFIVRVDARGADGFRIDNLPAIIVFTLRDGRIARIEEYLDSAQTGGFDASTMTAA